MLYIKKIKSVSAYIKKTQIDFILQYLIKKNEIILNGEKTTKQNTLFTFQHDGI